MSMMNQVRASSSMDNKSRRRKTTANGARSSKRNGIKGLLQAVSGFAVGTAVVLATAYLINSERNRWKKLRNTMACFNCLSCGEDGKSQLPTCAEYKIPCPTDSTRDYLNADPTIMKNVIGQPGWRDVFGNLFIVEGEPNPVDINRIPDEEFHRGMYLLLRPVHARQSKTKRLTDETAVALATEIVQRVRSQDTQERLALTKPTTTTNKNDTSVESKQSHQDEEEAEESNDAKHTALMMTRSEDEEANKADDRQRKQGMYTNIKLVNSATPINILWTPSFVDRVISGWNHLFLFTLEKEHGFRKITRDGVNIMIRPAPHKDKEDGPPILILHGIGCLMVNVSDQFANFFPNRTLVFPQHTTLAYTPYLPEHLKNNHDYATAMLTVMSEEGMRDIHLIAWSFGGLMRQYVRGIMTEKFPHMTIQREVLIEPLGTPVANVLGFTHGMLSFSDAYKRAKHYAPNGTSAVHAIVLAYLRYHVHTRPAVVDAAWNKYTQVDDDHSGKLYLISEHDIVAPRKETVAYVRKVQGLSTVYVQMGHHGSWPQNSKFKAVVQDWLRP